MFYTVDEVVVAKNILFAAVEDMSLDENTERPRNKIRRGDNRHRTEAEDVIDVWAFLDVQKATLPTCRR